MAGLIRLSKASITDAEHEAVGAALASGYLGMGAYVQRFERALQEYLGADHVVAVNTGTSALHLACTALGLRPGDEVLVPSLTYVACFQAIAATGARPVPCEVDPGTCSLDEADAEARVTPRTRAIMVVDYAGRPCDLRAVQELAQRKGLRVIEDAAHAFGSVREGRKVGSDSDIVCFSFDGIKNITCGEGGALVTTDAAIARYAMDARLLGVRKDTEARYQGARSWEFDVTHMGFRYHMSNLNAALGLAQLARFETELKPRRQALAHRYAALLGGTKGIAPLPLADPGIVPHIYPVKVPAAARDGLRAGLREQGIETGLHYYPNHLLSYFGTGAKLPLTEATFARLLTLPLHPELTDADVERVVAALRGGLPA
jgi:dTDP-4-amino-4,6-dideoxygalactose transaminase